MVDLKKEGPGEDGSAGPVMSCFKGCSSDVACGVSGGSEPWKYCTSHIAERTTCTSSPVQLRDSVLPFLISPSSTVAVFVMGSLRMTFAMGDAK